MTERLHVVPSRFVVEHMAQSTFPEDDEWIALVRAPEGLTVVREAPPWEEGEVWIGFYGGAERGPRRPDTLTAVANPLAEQGIPVFVASTYHADLVLVPESSRSDAAEALRANGFDIRP
ncbi:ACT domain-containing protein [Nocardia sp. CDC159]|uniref:ACT domain-containing protein n=1 Tax=Nocardia pulmonis TaxID=2951408 RepID=A0A9X2E480_9NOCA|nr:MULTISPECIES: ACT domain-containing protein [Nocardia]MCM6773539.1 ACT domain-containing protein [Nocardia pulmonis]MCM6786426.1 ACT domain-containing protein [Nocardia sp. CDC159]